LGSQARFKELFRTPIEKLGDPERLHQLRARITPFMLRRTKAVVADELPPKIETIMRVELSGQQADLYETIRLGMEKTVRGALVSKGLAKSQITIAARDAGRGAPHPIVFTVHQYADPD